MIGGKADNNLPPKAHELRNELVEELIVWRVNISCPEQDIAERRSGHHRGI